MNYNIKRALSAFDPCLLIEKTTSWNVCLAQHQCSLCHSFKRKICAKSITQSKTLNILHKSYKDKMGNRPVCYILRLSVTVLLWPPSSSQSAALLVVFRPLNYSGFVFKPIINLDNQSGCGLYIWIDIVQYYDPFMTIPCFYFCRFLPSVLLQHVEDTMVTSRLKWTVQTGGRVTSASTLILATPSGKAVVCGPFYTSPPNHSIDHIHLTYCVYCRSFKILIQDYMNAWGTNKNCRVIQFLWH